MESAARSQWDKSVNIHTCLRVRVSSDPLYIRSIRINQSSRLLYVCTHVYTYLLSRCIFSRFGVQSLPSFASFAHDLCTLSQENIVASSGSSL